MIISQRREDSGIIAELVRTTLELTLYKLGDTPLIENEMFAVSGLNYQVLLRGHTNLEAYGWAVYVGSFGNWQVTIKHDCLLLGTPMQAVLGNSTCAMLEAIPSERGLYRIHRAGLNYRAEKVRLDCDFIALSPARRRGLLNAAIACARTSLRRWWSI